MPSASGMPNLAMTLAPDALGDRYHVVFYGDDIAWLRVDPEDGRLYAINPEFGVFGVAKDTNEATNPTAVAAIRPGTGTLFTNVAYNEDTGEVWWEGKTPEPPADTAGWRDWTGHAVSDWPAEAGASNWAHPNSRFTTTLANVPNVAPDFENPRGVPIDAIIFGGRTRDREPLVRAITDLAEGVYDGLTLGAEATFAAEGTEGVLRYDPMSMRPFMSYSEGAYAAHWLKIIGAAQDQPIFAHVNWFQRDPEDGHFLWPGYRDNLRALLWLVQLKAGEVSGRQTPVGVVPTEEELDLRGMDLPAADLERLLTIDTARWRQEMAHREEHLAQFPDLPEEIWAAHRRVAAALDEDADDHRDRRPRRHPERSEDHADDVEQQPEAHDEGHRHEHPEESGLLGAQPAQVVHRRLLGRARVHCPPRTSHSDGPVPASVPGASATGRGR
jgi:phosphoenolpyruvate carboxykinase (GTP)